MKRNGDLGSKFHGGHEAGRIERSVVLAVERTGKGPEGEVDGEIPPGSLFDGAKAGLRGIAQGHADGRSNDAGGGGGNWNTEEGFVGERGDIKAESTKIVGEESGAANFGSDGVSKGVCESQTEGERRKFVDVGDKTPAVEKKRLNFELLLMAALFLADGVAAGAGNDQAAVDHAKVSVLDGSVFERASAEFGPLGGTAHGEILRAESYVEPRLWREVNGIPKNQTFRIGLTNDGKQDAGLANFFACRRGGIGKPDERNAEEAKVGVDEGDAFAETNARLGRIKLPGGMTRIADGDPAPVDEVNIIGETFDFGGLEKERILGNQDQGIGAAGHLDSTADVGEEAVASADVVAGLIGFQMLIVVVEANVAASEGFGGLFVVFDVICLEALIPEADIDFIIGNEKVAAFLLGAARPNLDIAGFGRVQGRLLRDGNRRRGTAQGIKKRHEEEKKAWRGGGPGMGATIQTNHLSDENSWIA